MTKVLMLGWEYPPHISGGLGTACQGLTRGLARLGTNISFVLPRLTGDELDDHMRILTPLQTGTTKTQSTNSKEFETGNVKTIAIDSPLSPYLNETTYQSEVSSSKYTIDSIVETTSTLLSASEVKSKKISKKIYGSNIFEEVSRFASLVLGQTSELDFDVIHAHDWMTYPAGVALAKRTGKPLIVHVHSLEYDRSGLSVNSGIRDIEQYGIDNAKCVIAVSEYTKNLIQQHYHCGGNKIKVVHNGIYPSKIREKYRKETGVSSKAVLFLGRVTFQKGPDYFVEAASKVIPHIPDVLFILAGSGDMLPRLIERVHELGIEKNFLFPGFLKGEAVERAFSSADLYVMPSVSEPFGISALEAINSNVPVLMSKQAGVSEVVHHALKFDFWDVNKFADLMINALIHDTLREDIVNMASEEIKKIKWDAAASKTLNIYNETI